MALTRFSPVAPSRPRSSERRQLALPARLTWKDASGAVRFASAVTRDISEAGVFLDVDGRSAIPLHRIVHVQLERTTRDVEGVPARLREGRLLAAVWRVAPCRASTGTPAGYALRFLVDPHEHASDRAPEARMAAAS